MYPSVKAGLFPVKQQWSSANLKEETAIPHGALPTSPATEQYRQRCGFPVINDRVKPEAPLKWGVWAKTPDEIKGMFPYEYETCVRLIERPYEIICGQREPANQVERRIVCDALNAMIVAFVERIMCIQLKFMEKTRNFGMVSRESIFRHCYCALLNCSPSKRLTRAEQDTCNLKIESNAAPYLAALAAYDHPTLLQFIEREVGTLYVFGVPILSTRSSLNDPGWRIANKCLVNVGSCYRLRTIVIGMSTEIIFAELVADQCTEDTIIIGKERSRTASFAFEVSSLQDTSEQTVRVLRLASLDFIIAFKWNEELITSKPWTGYGPTQRLVLRLLELKGSSLEQYIRPYCQKIMLDYQSGETLVNFQAFTPEVRGILNTLFSKSDKLEDLHSILIDTIAGPDGTGGTLRLNSDSQLHLITYLTDTWFGDSRVYTVVMLGLFVSALRDNKLQTALFQQLLPAINDLTRQTLATLAAKAADRFRNATYRVKESMVGFDVIRQTLVEIYRKNDGAVDESTVRFNASFWMNIRGYYTRMSQTPADLEEDIAESVSAYIKEIFELLARFNPVVPTTGSLPERYNLLNAHWTAYIKAALDDTENIGGDPSAKRVRTE